MPHSFRSLGVEYLRRGRKVSPEAPWAVDIGARGHGFRGRRCSSICPDGQMLGPRGCHPGFLMPLQSRDFMLPSGRWGDDSQDPQKGLGASVALPPPPFSRAALSLKEGDRID